MAKIIYHAAPAQEIPAKTETHICTGCPWSRFHGDRYSCIFIAGSCARIPGTVQEPLRGGQSASSALLVAQKKQERIALYNARHIQPDGK